ncbi:amidohydrolase family protein [Coriobacteriia bacterium Es71-Z0120]|uniref:amidohydrolase family protein n=1 Tax=Parvivirga hydrogeniphila TaxID=2939460 RepID=UPI002260E133|nr:amidohydrolase family protein [Parvivirga hydrogeniphila]MCL4079316.1 amidohydrolase family protein [Parvivirga hydrogeniphila]
MLLSARYVLPVSAPFIENGAVLVRDGLIVEVGLRDELKARYPDEEERDFGQAALMPGFVDLHTHLEYAVFRGMVDDAPYSQWKLQVMRKESALDAEDWAVSAELGATEAVRSGITTIADITDSGASVGAASAAGLRGVIYREVATMDRSQVERALADALDDVERWQQAVSDRIEVGLAPHSPYSCHPKLFEAVAQTATERGLPVAMHLAGSKDEHDFVKYGSSLLGQDYREASGWSGIGWLPTGVSPVRYVYQWGILEVPRMLAVHCVHLDEGDVGILAKTRTAVAYCPRCNLKLGMGIAPLQELMDAGVLVGIGTDSPASNSTMDFFDEMRIGLLVQRGLAGEARFYPAERFVRMATLEGARALGLDHLVGSLEAGKRADIVAVDLSRSHQVPTQDPYGAVVHTANQDDVLLTMIDGAVVFDRSAADAEAFAGLVGRADRVQAKLRNWSGA